MVGLKIFVILSFLSVSCIIAKEVTFKDVTLHGYSLYTHKFEVKIVSSNNIGENIPKNAVYDALEISNGTIPVLYENSVSDLDDVDELILVNDGIEAIRPGAFKNLPMLRQLTLKENKLHEIVEGVFNELAVSEIDLSHNSIGKIDSNAFSNMPNLMFVNLANNQITQWDAEWFAGDPLLTRVTLRHNGIETLPAAAFKNLAGNRSFGRVDLKLYIDLGNNKIKSLEPAVFSSLSKVGNLWLDHNELSHVDENLFQDLEIEFLSLSDNKIECLSGDMNKVLKAGTTYLDGNPWNCTCLGAIKEWSKRSENIVNFPYSEMECYAQRIRMKMDDLQNRLNEIKKQ